ncbi:TBC domain-containing protein, putative, partial [Perkinsus marinus ATCC 50983]
EKLPSKIGRVIEVDLRRTFPHHPAFQEDIVVERLRNILWAFAVFHPDVGYCQGMNFIAATMMMVVFDGAVKGEDPHREKEELTFWLLSQFITSDQGLHNSGYYQPGMTALLRDMYAFDRLSGRKATNAHRHLEECGIQDMSWICVEWFQTVYSTVFAFDTVLRIWDPIMTEGWKILFRVGVAIFKIFQDELDAMDFEHIMQNHKKLTSKFVDHNRLMKVAFYGLGEVAKGVV